MDSKGIDTVHCTQEYIMKLVKEMRAGSEEAVDELLRVLPKPETEVNDG